MKQFDDIKVRLTMRGICLFEQMSDKSFFKLSEEDLISFMYCVITACNDFNYSFETFCGMCGNRKIMDFLVKEYEKMFTIISQFNKNEQSQEDEQPQDSGETPSPKITDFCTALVVNVGLDPDYVYDKMQLYEINLYLQRYEEKEKVRLEEQRLWTYLTILPHLDSKKKVKPEDILPFTWEADTKKKRAEEDLKRKAALIKKIIGASIGSSSDEKEALKEKE